MILKCTPHTQSTHTRKTQLNSVYTFQLPDKHTAKYYTETQSHHSHPHKSPKPSPPKPQPSPVQKAPHSNACSDYTLVLDLDQTLVSVSTSEALHYIELDKNGKRSRYYVHIRPYAKEFLRNISKYFKIVIYTSSRMQYAKQIVTLLDKEHNYIKEENIISREMFMSNDSKKSLKKFDGFMNQNGSQEKCAIIDDNAGAWIQDDWENVVLSLKYYPSFSEAQLSTSQESHTTIETNDSKSKQLMSIERFLMKALYAHKLLPNQSFTSILSQSRRIFSNLEFHFCMAMQSEGLHEKLKGIITSMGGHISMDGSTSQDIIHVYPNECVERSNDSGYSKCISYLYILDCYYHLKRLDEDIYRVAFV